MSYFQESGLYYLQSRYYNPEVGRFLNADAYASTGQGLLGNNMFAYCRNNPVVHRDESGEIPAVVWGYLAASTVCGITNAVPVFRNDGSFIDGLKAFGIGMLGGTAGFGTAHLMKFTPQGAIIGRGVSTAICDVGTAWALTGKITEGDIALVSIDLVMDALFSTISYYYTDGVVQQLRYWIDPVIDGIVDNIESYLFFEQHSPSNNTGDSSASSGHSHNTTRGIHYALY